MLPALLITLLAAAPTVPTPVSSRATATLDVLVTDRAGQPLADATVTIEGGIAREGRTNERGRVLFPNVTVGTYVMQVERQAFVSFEKDVTVERGRQPVAVTAALSPLSSVPSRRSSPASVTAPRTGDAGTPRTVSIPDIAYRKLLGRNGVSESAIGCAGTTDARLLQLVEATGEQSNDEAEQMFYVVAGEATLRMNGQRASSIKPGSFSIIPRGTTYAIESKGRRPAIVLSVVGGQPCPATAFEAQR